MSPIPKPQYLEPTSTSGISGFNKSIDYINNIVDMDDKSSGASSCVDEVTCTTLKIANSVNTTSELTDSTAIDIVKTVSAVSVTPTNSALPVGCLDLTFVHNVPQCFSQNTGTPTIQPVPTTVRAATRGSPTITDPRIEASKIPDLAVLPVNCMSVVDMNGIPQCFTMAQAEPVATTFVTKISTVAHRIIGGPSMVPEPVPTAAHRIIGGPSMVPDPISTPSHRIIGGPSMVPDPVTISRATATTTTTVAVTGLTNVTNLTLGHPWITNHGLRSSETTTKNALPADLKEMPRFVADADRTSIVIQVPTIDDAATNRHILNNVLTQPWIYIASTALLALIIVMLLYIFSACCFRNRTNGSCCRSKASARTAALTRSPLRRFPRSSIRKPAASHSTISTRGTTDDPTADNAALELDVLSTAPLPIYAYRAPPSNETAKMGTGPLAVRATPGNVLFRDGQRTPSASSRGSEDSATQGEKTST